MGDFADLEARLNRVAVTHLRNRIAAFYLGRVAVVFASSAEENIPAGPGSGRPARVMSISAPEEDLGVVTPKRGDTVTISSIDYELVAKDTDATGWTTWTVRRK